MSSRLKQVQLSDWSGGLNTFDPPGELPINQSPDLDNIILKNKGFKKRTGDSAFNATAMNSGANVQGLAYYKEKGGNEFLVSIAGEKIFKSDSLDGTMDEISKAGGGTAPSAGQNNIYTPVILNNLLVWFGPTAPQKWDGSTATNDYEDLDDSPPTADFAFVMKDRCFAGRTTGDPSKLWWSALSDITDWSTTGAGGTGTQVFATNDGDNLTAGMPLNNDLALIFKQYSIHHLIVQTSPFPTKPLVRGVGCCGKNALVNVHGVIYFISKEPRMYVTDGYTVKLADPKGRIDPVWDGINKSRLDYIQGIYDPIRDLIHWHVSDGVGTTNDLDIIWDLKLKCWLRNTTGFDCNTTVLAQGYRFLGGHTDGKIYEKYKDSTYTDASEGSVNIDSYIYTPWIKGQSNDTVIHPRFLTLRYKTQTQGNVSYSYGFNDSQGMRSGEVSAIQEGGQWDVDAWDTTFIFGGTANAQNTEFVSGRGNNFQLKIFNNDDQPMELNSVSLQVKEQGTKEITNV